MNDAMWNDLIKLGGRGVGGREVGERLWNVRSSAVDVAPFFEESLPAGGEASL